MKVLVTGCNGHLGAAACADLDEHGFDVRGVDVQPPNNDKLADFHLLDLTAGQKASDTLASLLVGVDSVLHLAAIPVPRLGTPAAIFDLNCAATFRLFQACADHGIDQIVVASSINAIGYHFGRLGFEIDYLPVDEEHPKTTSDPYSFSKQVTEDIATYFARTANINSLCLRFGAGLQSLSMLREGLVPKLLRAREQMDRLAQMSATAAADQIRRLRHHHDDDRQHPDKESQLTADERSLMGLRHNVFSFIELAEACRAIRLALMHKIVGSQPMFVVDSRNTLNMPAQVLAQLMYPEVVVRAEFSENQSLVDWQRARSIGFESQVAAAELID